jgi:hypothetical protein
MTDRTRHTLRLRLQSGAGTDGPRIAPMAPPSPTYRPPAYQAPRPSAPARLEPVSRAILEELAVHGLADAPEP